MPEPNTGCWLWMGSVVRHGYGIISLGGREGRHIGAHRLSLILHGIDVPKDKVVMHKCDVSGCVNPEHLVVGTQAENIADMMRKGRHGNGADKLRGRKKTKGVQRGAAHPNFGNRITHCKHGHVFNEDNTVYGRDGHRRCRACRNRLALKRYHRLKATQETSDIKEFQDAAE